MSRIHCTSCGAIVRWRWQEAFDKFGYDDGDGHVGTPEVMAVLETAGYRCKAHAWGLHNTVIVSIEGPGGEQLIPKTATIGYDDPRDYLPAAIIGLLDQALPELVEVQP